MDICSIEDCKGRAKFESAYGPGWLLCRDHANAWDLTPMTIPEFVTMENSTQRTLWPRWR